MPAERVEEVEIEGKGKGWKYSDGSVRAEDGRLLVKPPYATSITVATSPELRARRVSLAQERTREGIAQGLGMDLSKASGGEEWQTLTRLFVEQFAKSKNLRGMAESYEKLGRASGYIVQSEEVPVLEAVTKSLLVLFEKLDRDTVEGMVIE